MHPVKAATEVVAQRRGPTKDEKIRPAVDPDVEVTITLPQSYAIFIEASYDGDSLEDKIAKGIKSAVLQEIEVLEPGDWARIFGSTMLADYERETTSVRKKA